MKTVCFRREEDAWLMRDFMALYVVLCSSRLSSFKDTGIMSIHRAVIGIDSLFRMGSLRCILRYMVKL